MTDTPKRMKAVPGKQFPTEWNKMAACFTELAGLGAFDLVAMQKMPRIGTFLLTEAMYRGMAAGFAVGRVATLEDDAWVELSPAVEYDLYPDFTRGYWFEGDLVAAYSRGSKWYVLGSGTFYEEGTADDDIAAAASGTINLEGGKTATARATFGGVSSGDVVGISWSQLKKRFAIVNAECAT